MSDSGSAPRRQADGSVKILVMDDDPTIADILGRMLKALGFQSQWAKTGEEAIELVKAAKGSGGFYDLALLDLTIQGGMGGREAMPELRKIDPEIITVACSGYSDDELNKELRAAGFTDILPKPFKSGDLGKMIKGLLKIS